MSLPQVIAVFHALFNVIGLPGNLLVIVTVALDRRFHLMRFILLASIAVSDFLALVLTNSFRISSTVQERWLYGQTMCYLHPFLVRYFYFNTVLHLIAVSYERYKAIVKSPLTYDGTITKSRVVLMFLIWVAPIPFSIGPFVGWGQYVYNPEVFSCEQAWDVHDKKTARNAAVFFVATFIAPSLIIVFLNWSVFKTAKTLRRNLTQAGRVGPPSLTRSESQLREISKKMNERKAAVDVCIIIAAFMLCFLPVWIVGICRQFVKSIKVPVKLLFVTNTIFCASSLCNPIVYSIRKRDFRTGVKNLLRQIEVCGSSNNVKANEVNINSFAFGHRLGSGTFNTKPRAAQETQHPQLLSITLIELT